VKKKEISLDSLERQAVNNDTAPVTAHELASYMVADYLENLWKCIKQAQDLIEGDFYVTVLGRRERLTPHIIRNLFMPRKSCPTPNTDQTVYRYNRKDDAIEFLWTIPSLEVCLMLKNDASMVVSEERSMLDFVQQFYDGSLSRMAARLNNEKLDDVLEPQPISYGP
jgi:hypothetical protein